MGDYAIKVENLGKSYRVGQGQAERYYALRDVLANRTRHFFSNLLNGGNPLKGASQEQDFWALKDVSFEVKHGEVLGIIGRNGAGKSTLLKLLGRITEPTEGRITINGRVASLLEVGTGFHPELTGRENIFLSGAILGMRRQEIRKKFDEIVDFAGVEKFLDTPVKRYSSGMYVRLGFAVAAHLEPEILLVDEVLAVGDAEFQMRCVEKIKAIVTTRKTVFMVSHNFGVIQSLCNKCLLLENGQLSCYNVPEVAIKEYSTNQSFQTKREAIFFQGPLNQKVKLIEVIINKVDALSDDVLVSQLVDIVVQLKFLVGNIRDLRVTLSIFCQGTRIFTCHDTKGCDTKKGSIMSTFTIPKKILRPGHYTIAIGGLEKDGFGDWFWRKDVCFFTVMEEWDDEIESINHGLINLAVNSSRTIIHDT